MYRYTWKELSDVNEALLQFVHSLKNLQISTAHEDVDNPEEDSTQKDLTSPSTAENYEDNSITIQTMFENPSDSFETILNVQ